MLRDGRLRKWNLVDDLAAHAFILFRQFSQDGNPCRMGQRLRKSGYPDIFRFEELGFRCRHWTPLKAEETAYDARIEFYCMFFGVSLELGARRLILPEPISGSGFIVSLR